MSLLLDALKKAAADKEKAASSITEEAENKKQPEHQVPDDELPQIEDEVFDTSVDVELLEEPIPEVSAEVEPNQAIEEDIELELPDEFELEESTELEKDSHHAEINTDETAEVEITELSKVNQQEALVETDEEIINKIQSQKIQAEIENSFVPERMLPEYNHNDARKILEVSQKCFRNKQRILYYGMYIFSALLFFIGSYLYYSAEALDNSQRPVFKPQKNSMSVNNTQPLTKLVVPVQTMVVAEETATEKNSQTKSPVSVAAVNTEKKITIVKQKKQDPISLLLEQAYQNYQSANYSEAEKKYQQVFQRDQRQRDALLGLAAIAVINNQTEKAKQYYQQVLRHNPKDSIANSAIVDLLKKEISVANESQLKLLLREDPDAAHVHFSLGLLYARQDRVKESQQAFFDAFALEKNADYAFNLAVMLDKLGQKKAALSYYKQASKLSDTSVVHFKEKAVLDRIEQLEASND